MHRLSTPCPFQHAGGMNLASHPIWRRSRMPSPVPRGPHAHEMLSLHQLPLLRPARQQHERSRLSRRSSPSSHAAPYRRANTTSTTQTPSGAQPSAADKHLEELLPFLVCPLSKKPLRHALFRSLLSVMLQSSQTVPFLEPHAVLAQSRSLTTRSPPPAVVHHYAKGRSTAYRIRHTGRVGGRCSVTGFSLRFVR